MRTAWIVLSCSRWPVSHGFRLTPIRTAHMRSHGVFTAVLIAAAAVGFAGTADAPQAVLTAKGRPLVVPAGYTVERVAGPPLVSRPINACFDDEGRLYVTESAGE